MEKYFFLHIFLNFQQNNFYFQPNTMFFPENAFSYNNAPVNTQKNQKNKNLNNSNSNNVAINTMFPLVTKIIIIVNGL